MADPARAKRLAKRTLRRWMYPHLEGRVFQAADAVVCNTPSMVEAYRTRTGACDVAPEILMTLPVAVASSPRSSW